MESVRPGTGIPVEDPHIAHRRIEAGHHLLQVVAQHRPGGGPLGLVGADQPHLHRDDTLTADGLQGGPGVDAGHHRHHGDDRHSIRCRRRRDAVGDLGLIRGGGIHAGRHCGTRE